MSRSTNSMAQPDAKPSVVRLPTAVTRRVKQPTGFVSRRSEHIAQGVAQLPVEFIPPWQRREQADAMNEQATFDAGGISRSAAHVMLSVIFGVLSDDQKRLAISYAELMAMLAHDDQTKAAHAYLRSLARHLS